MNCKEFQHWLPTKGTAAGKENPEILDHLKECVSCRNLYNVDTRLEKSIESVFYQTDIPEDMFDNIELTLTHEKSPAMVTKFRITGLAAILSMILVAAYMIFFNKPFQYRNLQQLSEQAVARHLKGDIIMSFTGNEIAKARVMLSKELNFNVIIPDLRGKGYTLLGGRLCVLGKCKIVYLCLKKGKKRCSLFIMGYDHLSFELADGSRFSNIIKGCHTDIWKDKGQVYAMVY